MDDKKWYVGKNAYSAQGLIIDEETGRNVAVSYDKNDAALIAAAPDMLEALKRIDEFVKNNLWENEITFYPMIKAAIQKALGE